MAHGQFGLMSIEKSITYVVWIESVTENSTVSCHS